MRFYLLDLLADILFKIAESVAVVQFEFGRPGFGKKIA
jgi:hypothetical protein